MGVRVDKFFMAISAKTSVDGLWIGALGDSELLQRVCEALKLIKLHDPLRYERIRKDVRRIWVQILPGGWGQYSACTETCEIDCRFVASCDPIFIASIIVHEATHARLRRLGYAEALRHRLEMVCWKQQLAFAKKHPGGEVVSEWLRGAPPSASDFTNGAFAQRYQNGQMEAALHMGIPSWVIKISFFIRTVLEQLIKLRRRISGVRQPG